MSLIRKLATRREAKGETITYRYDPERAVSDVLEEGQWIPSWNAAHPPESKKADLETGEDQKGE